MVKEFILLMGPPGSGKTTYCKEVLTEYTRVSQDEKSMGHWQKLIKEGVPMLVVDRMNQSKLQRKKYLSYAKENGYYTKIIYLDVPFEVCLQRAIKRENHPTIKDESTARAALGIYLKEFELPFSSEADIVLIKKFKDPK